MSAEDHSFARCGALIGLVLALAPCALAARQDEHIFEPGKKHICVPAADRKSWNCGSAEDPPAATPKPDGPTLRSARAADLDESERAAAAAAAEAPPAGDPPESVAAPSSSNRSVPSYLLSPEAASAPVASSAPVETQPAETKPVETKTAEPPPPAAVEPVAAAPVETAPVVAAAPPPAPEPATVVTDAKPPMPEPEPARVVTQAKPAAPEPPTTISKPSVAAAPPTTIAAPPEPAVAAPRPAVVETQSERVAESKAAQAEPAPAQPSPPVAEPVAQRAPEPSRAAALRNPDAFRTLADARYVLELARGGDRAAVEADAAQVPLTHGDVYLLPLQRDGASWYVAVWGDFDSIDSARAARSEALAAGNAGVGWPRRVGPLKQELRLVR